MRNMSVDSPCFVRISPCVSGVGLIPALRHRADGRAEAETDLLEIVRSARTPPRPGPRAARRRAARTRERACVSFAHTRACGVERLMRRQRCVDRGASGARNAGQGRREGQTHVALCIIKQRWKATLSMAHTVTFVRVEAVSSRSESNMMALIPKLDRVLRRGYGSGRRVDEIGRMHGLAKPTRHRHARRAELTRVGSGCRRPPSR